LATNLICSTVVNSLGSVCSLALFRYVVAAYPSAFALG
jgi:hypothetical protein